MFSAILGLAGAGMNFALGSQQNAIAQQELQLKRQALRDQKDMSMLNYGMGRDQLRREREQEEYIRRINEENARFSRQEYYKREAQYQQRLNQAMAERQYVVDRQIQADRDAAEQQAFMLEQYLENKNLAKEEREFAINELQRARAVAQGERDEDLRKRAEEQQRAQVEREFAISEMQNSQMIAEQERMDDMMFREDIIGRLDLMSNEIDRAYSDMPQLTAPDLLGQDDFNEVLARFDANAIANVDRAADRVASQNEAALMTRGLANSSIGTSARGDVARRLTLEYDNARRTAMQEALAFITGSNNVELQGFNALKDARASRAEEIRGSAMPTVEAMLASRSLSSANDYQTPVPINSAVIQRGVKSANDYQSPVAVGSSIYQQNGIGSSMAQSLGAPSVADAFVFNSGTRAVAPATWNISNPSSYLGTAAQLQQGVVNGYDPNPYFNRAASYNSEGMGALGYASTYLGYSGGTRNGGGNAAYAAGVPPSQSQYSVPIPQAHPYGGATQFGYY